MANPFAPITIAGMEIRNRFMRSATWDSSATDDGEVTDISVRIIEGLARGGVGLIVTGYAYVSEEGKAAIRQYGISEDRHVEGLRRLVKAAHDHGAKIAAQIAHGGINTRMLLRRDGQALGPSQIEGHPWEHRAMTAEEVEATVREFRRCRCPGQGGRVRRCPVARRSRLFDDPVPLAANQPPDG